MSARRLLTVDEARQYYDSFGAKQDSQSFYEDPALEELIRESHFGTAESVIEFGSGTGRFAKQLLVKSLPPHATYLGLDTSSIMVDLARTRLNDYDQRAEVILTDGSIHLPASNRSCDRVVSNYVLDLLSPSHIDAFVEEAQRVLKPEGLLCLVSLTFGKGMLSRFVSMTWDRIHAIQPKIVGGCRPVNLLSYLNESYWQIKHHSVQVAYGISSEVVVAKPIGRVLRYVPVCLCKAPLLEFESLT
ncbi:class I SAM-dependent methyltransferase [Alicyclobacillus sp. SO9]|uniref:class I SAM-dependent methyltransferase n=1 Tax=Alicyclobacillus sp. SO9 TaxID=2665646 RepID=UPI0018E72E77|nr:class I SAM-dependent methyltransferase [Alicyclobacillus sp. SO9]QQE79994.1 class I SAM-dependent methyltransferase [Alicyclobacillus sp. SO9]